MRIMNNIFAAIFGLVGIAALLAVISGAYHQLFVAAMCLVIVIVLLIENKRLKA